VSNKHVFEATFEEKVGRYSRTATAHSITVRFTTAAGWTSHTFQLNAPDGKPLWKPHSDADLGLLPFNPPHDATLRFWTAEDILPSTTLANLLNRSLRSDIHWHFSILSIIYRFFDTGQLLLNMALGSGISRTF
jgi:hypothetical protein